MIKVNENVITAETKTQKVVFVDGRITEIISKIDGQRYLNDNGYSEREAPLRLKLSDTCAVRKIRQRCGRCQ